MRDKPLTIVFCLPGNSFSAKFIAAWTELVAYCLANGIKPVLSCRQSCNIYYVRNMCLGADVMRGKNQKPFDGMLDYDYLMWIDSDILFTPRQIEKLLCHEMDIVSGIYLMEGGRALATVMEWDEEFFEKHGYFQFMTPKEIEGKSDLIEVSYTGMGFMLIKRGVFEKMEYPWFRPIEKQIGNIVDFTMEDVAFCLSAKEKGFKVFIDPAVRVGHEKSMVM
jgi:GT2 family glycosyltransferase